MKAFVTGAGGQLGHDVVNELKKRGHTAIGSSRRLLDITGHDQVMSAVTTFRPDVMIHCAAWTDVDGAEDKKNRDQVYSTNVQGTVNLVRAAEAVDAKMIYISTDYVFGGKGETPWKPDDRNFAPLNYYGKTKLEGEMAVSGALDKFFIVRTSWAFAGNGKNFVRTMVNAGRKYGTVRVVSDQIGTPTYCYDLARLLADMAESDKYGYYHATNEGGYISWYDFACEIYRQMGMDTKVIPVTTEEYGLSKAARPLNSRLDKSKLAEAGFRPLPEWKNALERYLNEEYLKSVNK